MLQPDCRDLNLEGIDAGYLTPIVQAVLNDAQAKVAEFTCQPIQGGLELNSQVIRYKGSARVGDQVVPWSLILKVVTYVPENNDPGAIHYWKREALGYQTGLYEHLPGKVTAPHCYAVTEMEGKGVWLWLEDIHDEVGTWALEQYGETARHLGEMNGAYLNGLPLPDQPWIPKDWLRQYVEHAAPQVDFIRNSPDDPLVKKMYPGAARWIMLTFWEERLRFLKKLDSLPQVFSHQDAFKKNLFARNDQTVAIDWTYMGWAPVGAELVALVGASIGLELPLSQIETLDQVTFKNYLTGLRSTGWQGKPRDIRLAYCLTLVLRYVIGANVGELFPWMRDPKNKEWLETNFGQTTQEIEDANAAQVKYYTDRTIEGLRLLGFFPLLGILLRAAVRSLRKA